MACVAIRVIQRRRQISMRTRVSESLRNDVGKPWIPSRKELLKFFGWSEAQIDAVLVNQHWQYVESGCLVNDGGSILVVVTKHCAKKNADSGRAQGHAQ